MTETRATRIKRLKMRSMRRGIKEMDIILTAYADANLENMTADQLDTYDVLLRENDQDLYQWVTCQQPAPVHLSALVNDVAQTFSKNSDGF